jgi:hypothetical protein
MCLEKDVSSSVMYLIICELHKKHLATVEGESPLIRKNEGVNCERTENPV